jgi:hypothetical protein
MTSSDADRVSAEDEEVVAAAGLVAAIIVAWRRGFNARIMS